MSVWILLFIVLSVATAISDIPSHPSSPLLSTRKQKQKKIVIGVDGGTESIRACCFDAETGRVVGKSCASPYETYHPNPGWAEQDPNDWYECMGKSVRGAIDSLQQEQQQQQHDEDNDNDNDYDYSSSYEICCICVDTTCCSVVALDENNEPLRRCLLWMDARSASQTEQIMEKCRNDPALLVNCGGEGPISAEWMTPKALWIRQNEPDVWDDAKTICEYQDFINFKLTGKMCASSCNAATRWHWDGEECLKAPTPEDKYPGRPISLYETLEIPELADKLPERCIPMGALVGRLTTEAAKHLNLPEGTPVAQGGPDAFVGMVGLGCTSPGQLCLITGSSHLHCVVSSTSSTAPGTWGAYKGAPLPGICFAEGGQSSTGSIIRWARNIFGLQDATYKELDDDAATIPPGCEGLVALETFQGSRTPVTDPLQRGALLGLTLSHTRSHIWRALLESVCFGTRACLEGLERAGHGCDEIVIAGGATRSDLWLQMHADVTGKPVVVCEFADAPLLGCAILASVSAGVHETVDEAIGHMVRKSKRIVPSETVSKTYDELYNRIYRGVGSATRPVAHAIAAFSRGGHVSSTLDDEQPNGTTKHGTNTVHASKDSRTKFPTISPSLLASDWSNIRGEIQRCLDAGTNRLHIDIFDGVFLDSPHALTFGPKMVEAMRRCSENDTILDLHVCVERPARYIQAMKEAGGNTFIFQWEAVKGGATETGKEESLEAALEIARAVVKSGMDCGISINPSTKVEEIYPLLQSGLIAVVDVLAVEPGFGGQRFQESAVEKIKSLCEFRQSDAARNNNDCSSFEIMVDGGINKDTARRTIAADILVAGTYLFNRSDLKDGVDELQISFATAVADAFENV
jgi:ribulose-phosphate 3-epimerase